MAVVRKVCGVTWRRATVGGNIFLKTSGEEWSAFLQKPSQRFTYPLKQDLLANNVIWKLELHMKILYSSILSSPAHPTFRIGRIGWHAPLHIFDKNELISRCIEALVGGSISIRTGTHLHVTIVMSSKVRNYIYSLTSCVVCERNPFHGISCLSQVVSKKEK